VTSWVSEEHGGSEIRCVVLSRAQLRQQIMIINILERWIEHGGALWVVFRTHHTTVQE